MEVWLRKLSTRMFRASSPVRICIVSRKDRGFLWCKDNTRSTLSSLQYYTAWIWPVMETPILPCLLLSGDWRNSHSVNSPHASSTSQGNLAYQRGAQKHNTIRPISSQQPHSFRKDLFRILLYIRTYLHFPFHRKHTNRHSFASSLLWTFYTMPYPITGNKQLPWLQTRPELICTQLGLLWNKGAVIVFIHKRLVL